MRVCLVTVGGRCGAAFELATLRDVGVVDRATRQLVAVGQFRWLAHQVVEIFLRGALLNVSVDARGLRVAR